jgi:hypothetical protein
MYICRRTQKRGEKEATYILLAHNSRTGEGKSKTRTLYLGAEHNPELIEGSKKRLRRAGYTPKQIEAVLDAIRARVDRNEYASITVRGKLVAWRDIRNRK